MKSTASSPADSRTGFLRALPPSLWAVIGIAVVTAAIWVPFGLHKFGLVEDWTFFHSFDRGRYSGIVPGRPLTALGWAIGYWLTPDSFVGLNIVHIVCFLAKGLLLFGIVRRLAPASDMIAFVAAALFIIYPSDEAIFSSRNTNYHVAVVLFLAGVYYLLAFYRKGSSLILILSAVSVALSILTIEIAIPLALATPLLLLIQRDVRNRKRLITAMVIWYVAVIGASIVPMRNLLTRGSYHAMLLRGDQAPVSERVRVAAYHLGRAYHRNAFQAWGEIPRQQPIRLYVAIATGTGIILGLLALLFWKIQPPTRGSIQSARVLLIMGLLWIGLGFIVFLPLPYHRAWNDGNFLFSSAGAAITVATVLTVLSYAVTKRPYFLAISTALLAALAVFDALHQHRRFMLASLLEGRILSALVRQAPGIQDRSLLLIFDPNRELRSASVYLFGVHSTSAHLGDAIRYLYNTDKLWVLLCYPKDPVWGGSAEACRLEPDGVQVHWSGQDLHKYPYERVLAFEYETGELTLAKEFPEAYRAIELNRYAPERLIDANLPRRARMLVEHGVPDQPSLHEKAVDRLRLDFDRRLTGSGWSEPENSRIWMNAEKSVINLVLKPGQDYRLTFRVAAAIKPELIHSLVVNVNGRQIPLMFAEDREGGKIYFGRIPQAAIARASGQSRLIFEIDDVMSPLSLGMNADSRELGLLFDWLSIEAD